MNNFYELNADKYITETINCDMNDQYQLFLKYMPNSGLILDIGFGSGRDMTYFKSIGYEVKGIDPTPSFVAKMKEKGYDVSLKYSEDLDDVAMYDGVWASASLLHVQRAKLKDVLVNIYQALKDNGIFYLSFKYGDYEGVINDRYFNYINETILETMIKDTNFKVLATSISNDVRVDHKDEKWLNVVLKKY